MPFKLLPFNVSRAKFKTCSTEESCPICGCYTLNQIDVSEIDLFQCPSCLQVFTSAIDNELEVWDGVTNAFD